MRETTLECSFHLPRCLPKKSGANYLKRLFDLAFSFLFLCFFSYIYLLVSIAVKCSSKGSIFYKSRRVGKDGKLFDCFKFRTMYEDAESRLDDILASNPVFAEEWAQFDKLKFDPRVTSVGRFLRKTSLDELPQFFNVLKGDLSVVGPRPYDLEASARLLENEASSIFSVRPGITGIWQVSGRNALSFQRRRQLDVLYAERHSFWQDMKLLCKTIPAVLRSKGAF
ncbi:MAG: sugar transferase [Chlamydiae bacterium]|nr:sugar transferase [Chlamydiota bacterium]